MTPLNNPPLIPFFHNDRTQIVLHDPATILPLLQQLIDQFKSPENIVSIVKHNFITIPNQRGLIPHLTHLIETILFAPIVLEITSISVQLFSGQLISIGILSNHLQQLLLQLRSQYRDHFNRVLNFSSVADCKHNDTLTGLCYSFRLQLVNCMIVYILVDGQIVRDGRYQEDVREICLAALANVVTLHWVKIPQDIFVFLKNTRRQVLLL